MKKEQLDVAEIARKNLNVVIMKETKRANGTVRIQQDFTNCPTLAEQHTAHLSDLNYLIQKYKPDELAAYIAARSQYRQEILGHDFSQELSLQDAGNLIHASKNEFEKLPHEIRTQFRNHLEFIKFIDNPANADRLVEMGLMTRKQIETISIKPQNSGDTTKDDTPNKGKTRTKTQDEDKE